MQISLHDSSLVSTYATGGQTRATAFLTGIIKIEKAELAILNSDIGNAEATQK